uniref:acyltransferase domain-containing protein n=1 Tax=Streptomyces sp. NBC_00857 TaxID=2975851 RepID=UPI002F90ABBA|nr:acyltransferase domain-containing protein [Streptomyces sp. NBC_00857]
MAPGPASARERRAARPEIPFYSTVLEDPQRTPSFDATYWCANLRCPVRFTSAVAAAAADRNLVYVDVSPHPVVTRALTENLSPLVTDSVVLPTLRREEDEPTEPVIAVRVKPRAGSRAPFRLCPAPEGLRRMCRAGAR